jgi:subtilase family serine protease
MKFIPSAHISALSFCMLLSAVGLVGNAQTDSASVTAQIKTEASCARPKPGEVACNAVLRSDEGMATADFMAQANDIVAPRTIAPKGYGPADLRKAYRIPLGGVGQTVAVIDALDDPKAEADLAVYRAQYGLPACTSANGCFTKIAQDGTANYPKASAAWSGETSLDIDMVSALCPDCRILLVEANSPALKDMILSVDRAAAYHPAAISNSYGGPEFPAETQLEQYYNRPGIVMTASAGDSGYGSQFPAVSRYVVAVGGTKLMPSPTDARGFIETAWNKSGSGCSTYEPKPEWQHDTACRNRTMNDMAFVASAETPVAVYQSFCGGSVCGWIQYAGTSIGAPAVAAIYAAAGNTAHIRSAPEALYLAGRTGFHDIALGSNGSCPVTALCNASAGYDAPTGNGSPAGIWAF